MFFRLIISFLLVLSINELFAQQPKLMLPVGHTDFIYTASFSPDGKKVVTGSADRTVKVWDVITGKLILDIRGHEYEVGHAVFSKDGQKIISSDWFQIVKVWDANTGEALQTYENNQELIDSLPVLEISPDEKKKLRISENDFSVDIINIESGILTATLKGFTSTVYNALFSNDGKKIITASGDFVARIWDIKSGEPVNLVEHDETIFPLQLSLDDSRIITAIDFQTANLYEVDKRTKIAKFKIHEKDMFNSYNCFYYPEFSLDSKKIIGLPNEEHIKLYSAADSNIAKVNKPEYLFKINTNGKEIDLNYRYKSASKNIRKIKDSLLVLKKFNSLRTETFSPDGKIFVTSSFMDSSVSIWDVPTGKLLTSFIGHDAMYTSPKFSPNSKILITSVDFETATFRNANTGEILYEKPKAIFSEKIGSYDGFIFCFFYPEFSRNGKKVITISSDDRVTISDAAKGNEFLSFKSTKQLSKNSYPKFSANGKKIIVATVNGTTDVWDAITGKQLYSHVAINENDYINILPSGYYKCPPNVSKLLYYITSDNQIITFEQLDVKYNRPDKVLEAIGNTDTALIKSYRKAYEKRIKKLGIDTTQFRDGYSVPEADFANRDEIEYEQKNGTLKLHIKGIDSTYKLDRFNVWVNEAPLYGQRSIRIKKKNTNNIDTTITITLSQGENRIETSITNINGTESYRMPMYVNYTPAVKQKEMTRFIGIGIDKFSESKYDLQYSSKDIRDLAKKLKEKYKDDIVIDTLFNENVTVSNVKALKQKLQQTSVNDKVIISYSGHGMLSKDYDYYLSTYAVNFQKPEENGLSYEELENLLDSIPARKKLMLIDACHSGEVDKDERMAMQKMADSLGLKKGIIIEENATQTQQLGLKNSFELMQSLFVNVGKSTGATIISAAAGNQFALERGDLKNGVFTYSILEAMEKNPTMKISELKKIVGERVEQLTNGMQKPTSRNETIAVDWRVW